MTVSQSVCRYQNAVQSKFIRDAPRAYCVHLLELKFTLNNENKGRPRVEQSCKPNNTKQSFYGMCHLKKGLCGLILENESRVLNAFTHNCSVKNDIHQKGTFYMNLLKCFLSRIKRLVHGLFWDIKTSPR